MTADEEIIRAGHAREILDSALFQEARTHIASQIRAQMEKAPIADQQLHTRLIMMLQLWRALEAYFEQIAETGKLAEIQIEQERARRLWQFASRA